MAETASQIISDALVEILVAADSEHELPAVDMSTGVRYLNRMMDALAADGIGLGFTKLTGPSDTVTIADGAIDGVVALLALRLAPQFDVGGHPFLVAAAKSGYKTLLNITVVVQPTQMPCTMPIGSGNERVNGSFGNNKFFSCPEDTTLTEGDGNILLEGDT